MMDSLAETSIRRNSLTDAATTIGNDLPCEFGDELSRPK